MDVREPRWIQSFRRHRENFSRRIQRFFSRDITRNSSDARYRDDSSYPEYGWAEPRVNTTRVRLLRYWGTSLGINSFFGKRTRERIPDVSQGNRIVNWFRFFRNVYYCNYSFPKETFEIITWLKTCNFFFDPSLSFLIIIYAIPTFKQGYNVFRKNYLRSVSRVHILINNYTILYTRAVKCVVIYFLSTITIQSIS